MYGYAFGNFRCNTLISECCSKILQKHILYFTKVLIKLK